MPPNTVVQCLYVLFMSPKRVGCNFASFENGSKLFGLLGTVFSTVFLRLVSICIAVVCVFTAA